MFPWQCIKQLNCYFWCLLFLFWHLHSQLEPPPWFSHGPLHVICPLIFPSSPTPMFSLYFSDFCGDSMLYTHLWGFKVRTQRWERIYGICLSGSMLSDSIHYFLVAPVYLKIPRVSFSWQIIILIMYMYYMIIIHLLMGI